MTELGKYEIIEEIGRGGFAVVYQARDTDLDRVVALKVLHPYWTADANFVTRFRREARAAARLRHPNVVTVHEAGEFEGQLYIAMEYLPGRNLRELLDAEGALSLERALPILEQVADALDYAHAQGLVHRDVKPGNVRVEEAERDIRATLTDFGLVKAMAGSSVLTSHGTLLGSPEYMAPEQADPERVAEIGPATDRYALGIVAYQMLTGRVPFPGNTPATLNAHLNLAPPAPQAMREDLPPDVAVALLNMLAKSPGDRFASAHAFVARLRDALLAESQVREREAQLAPLYEQLQAAAAREDWAEVLTLGGRIQALDAGYRDVSQWVAQARERLQRPKRRPVPAWAWWAVAGGAILVVLVGLGVALGPRIFGTGPAPLVTEAPTERPTAVSTVAPVEAATEQLTKVPPAVPTEAPIEPPTEEPTQEPGTTRTRPTDGMVMVHVPGGTFQMGSGEGDPDADDDEFPQHSVTLDGFWIDQTEVTNARYRQCVETGACQAPTACYWGEPTYGEAAKADHPVVCVDWSGAAAYCEWVGARLPTEAEWEYAARGPGNFIYPWGIWPLDITLLNYHGNVGATTEVGSYPRGASWCGAQDLAGNVWEWVVDWWGKYPSEARANPTGPETGQHKVLRGGGWTDAQEGVRAADRYGNTPDSRGHDVGFRCVGQPGEPAEELISETARASATPDDTWPRPADGMVMVYVPGGTFQMGSDEADPDAYDEEFPQHSVTLDAFWIDQTEVTNAQYRQCVETGVCQAPATCDWGEPAYGEAARADHPVVCVDWSGAAAYCEWAGARLPTEAEWEYAARGPQGSVYPWGGEFDGTRLNYCDANCEESWADEAVDDGYADTAPAGSYPGGASWCGALDMAGNVWEWVADWYGGYPSEAQTNPVGPTVGDRKVLRGGGWHNSQSDVRTTCRGNGTPEYRAHNVGFRCVGQQ